MFSRDLFKNIFVYRGGKPNKKIELEELGERERERDREIVRERDITPFPLP